MKMLVILAAVAAALTACTRQEGTFQGRLVDATWGGAFVQTCELDFQYGEQSSKLSEASHPDRAFCDRAKNLVGTVVKAEYSRSPFQCFFCDSVYVLKNLEVGQ